MSESSWMNRSSAVLIAMLGSAVNGVLRVGPVRLRSGGEGVKAACEFPRGPCALPSRSSVFRASAGRRAGGLRHGFTVASLRAHGMAGTVSSPPITLETPMSDDKNNAGSPDRDRINVNEDYELRYWTTTLGVSADELRAAVAAVAPTAVAVRKHLGK